MGEQLDTVANALEGWHANSEEEMRCVEQLKRYVPSFLDGGN